MDSCKTCKYKTVKGAKRYFKRLAEDFLMKQWVFDRIDRCQTVSEVEHVWWGALATI